MTKKSAITRDDRIKIIKENICLLPPDYRKIFEMFYIEKLPQDQIAKKLDLPINKIKHHLSKGRYLIKKNAGCEEFKNAFRILYGKVQKNL